MYLVSGLRFFTVLINATAQLDLTLNLVKGGKKNFFFGILKKIRMFTNCILRKFGTKMRTQLGIKRDCNEEKHSA